MNLTPKQIQAIRIAVAKLDGFSHIRMVNGRLVGRNATQGIKGSIVVPNYVDHKESLSHLECRCSEGDDFTYQDTIENLCFPLREADATALQRCIALLITLAPDKWLEIQNLKD